MSAFVFLGKQQYRELCVNKTKEIKMFKYIRKYLFWECLCKIFFLFLGAKICHAIISCNTDETTLFFVIYNL